MSNICDWCKAAVHEGTHLCDDCRTTLTHAILNTGAHYADLETVRTRTRGVRYDKSGGKGGTKERPLGMDLRFARLARDESGKVTEGRATEVEHLARNAAVTWARVVLDHWPHTTTRPADNIPAVCAFLASVTTAIAGQPWAGDMLRDFRTTERKLAHLVDIAPPKWYAGKCSAPTDGTDEATTETECKVDLYARSEKGSLTCPGCGAEHDISGRREVLLEEAKDILVTATEAAGALLAWTDYGGTEERLVDRIRKWQERGRLTGRGNTTVSGKQRTLYRLGDIQERMVDDAQRHQEKRITAA